MTFFFALQLILSLYFDVVDTRPSSGVAKGGAAFWITFMKFFPNYFEQPLLCCIAYLLVVNHLTVLLNTLAQTCGNGPAISFTLQCIPASLIKI